MLQINWTLFTYLQITRTIQILHKEDSTKGQYRQGRDKGAASRVYSAVHHTSTTIEGHADCHQKQDATHRPNMRGHGIPQG